MKLLTRKRKEEKSKRDKEEIEQRESDTHGKERFPDESSANEERENNE